MPSVQNDQNTLKAREMDPDLRDQAPAVGLAIYHRLKPLKNDILYFQDAFTFYRPIPSICLYLILNYLFYLIQYLNLPLYPLLSICVCLAVVPRDYYLYIFHVLCYWFARPANQVPPPGKDRTLPVDILSARLGTLHCCMYHLLRTIKNSLARFSFVDVSVITFVISAVFYLTHLLGDRLVTWTILQCIFVLPLVITRRIGFKGLAYPDDLEIGVLEAIRQVAQRAEEAASPPEPDPEAHPEPEAEPEAGAPEPE
jgi:hypothetical protein